MLRCRAQSKEKTLCPNLQDVKNFIRIRTKLFFHEESLTNYDSGIKHVMFRKKPSYSVLLLCDAPQKYDLGCLFLITYILKE